MEKVLILRACRQDRTSHKEFQWPESSPVEAPDWSPKPECGRGLHGLLWGEGNSSHLAMYGNPLWQVVEVDSSDIIDLDGKVKFPRGEVIYTGTREGATGLIYKSAPNGTIIHYLSLTGGNHSTLTGGEYSTLTGGNHSTLTGGDNSTLTGGYNSALTGGEYSTLTGGYDSTLTGGYGSVVVWVWHEIGRKRVKSFEVGIDGVEPNVPYRLIDGKLTRV